MGKVVSCEIKLYEQSRKVIPVVLFQNNIEILYYSVSAGKTPVYLI